MMSDLISRQDAIDALGEEPPVWYDGEDEIAERNQWRRDKAAIESLPSRITEYKTFCGVPIEEAARIVQEHNAEPKTGEWVEEDEYGDLWVCDQCGFAIMCEHKANFCPNCGARMTKGGDDE